jgi:cell division protein ZapE
MAAMLVETYNRLVEQGELRGDSAQYHVIEQLNRLQKALQEPANALGWLKKLRNNKSNGQLRSIYIWGPVGRGKTMLLDLFHAAASGERKRRVHFHAFMLDVHQRMHMARKSADANTAISRVAGALARQAQILCLDEMQIADIADAMIVGRLFEALLKEGTVIVTTSNAHPDELYKNGLNRPLFEPFINLIADRFDVVSLDGPTDYRLGRIKAYETYLTPLGSETSHHIQRIWEKLTDTVTGSPQSLEVLARKLLVPQAAKGCARFTFADLCVKPLSAADYLAVARAFQVVVVENIPVLGPDQRNEAKRFILLIDTLYDQRKKLVASADVEPEGIYGRGDHEPEFARTISRLREMQSASWWGGQIVET